MTRHNVALAALLLALTSAAVAIAAGLSTPDDLRLPIHWGLDGTPDRFAGKWTGLLLPPAVIAGASLLFWFLPALEPRREGLERSQGLYLWGWVALLLMGGAIQLAVLSTAFGWDVPVDRLITGALGAMLLLIGNQLGKSRSMYLIGVRTPWTLASEEVWMKTHRLAGKLMAGGGLLILGAALLPLGPGLLPKVVITVVVIAAVVPVAQSYLLWRHEQSAQPRE